MMRRVGYWLLVMSGAALLVAIGQAWAGVTLAFAYGFAGEGEA